jgi:hypothetical protein
MTSKTEPPLKGQVFLAQQSEKVKKFVPIWLPFLQRGFGYTQLKIIKYLREKFTDAEKK